MIDLKIKMESASIPEPPDDYYPTVHIERKEPFELPEEGTMTVTFKRISVEDSERDGKKRFSCTLELRSIDKVNGKKVSKAEAEDSDYTKREKIIDDLRDLVEGNK